MGATEVFAIIAYLFHFILVIIRLDYSVRYNGRLVKVSTRTKVENIMLRLLILVFGGFFVQFGIPQILWLLLFIPCLFLLKESTDKQFNFLYTLTSLVLVNALYFWGGFFDILIKLLGGSL